MKQFILVVCVSLLTASAGAQQKKAVKPAAKPNAGKTKAAAPSPLKSQLDSFSYALGLNIANNLKLQNIENISYPAMQKAMEDIFKGRTPACNEQEANMVIQRKLQESAGVKSGAEKAKGAKFLADNKKRAGVTALPNGLQYEVITKGDETAPSPKLQDTVIAHYAGSLIDGKEFDNSYKRGEPLTIPVAGVIRGWTEILQLMHPGDKWKVFIPSELGYGDRGAGADIPGGAVLVFEMELISVKAAGAQPAADAPKADTMQEEKKN